MARGVSIDHVTFGYGATPVLADVSLDVERGEALVDLLAGRPAASGIARGL